MRYAICCHAPYVVVLVFSQGNTCPTIKFCNGYMRHICKTHFSSRQRIRFAPNSKSMGTPRVQHWSSIKLKVLKKYNWKLWNFEILVLINKCVCSLIVFGLIECVLVICSTVRDTTRQRNSHPQVWFASRSYWTPPPASLCRPLYNL